MKYSVYKFEFNAGVHIGDSSLEDSEFQIHADTIFSALCLQALQEGGETGLNAFCDMAREGRITISDAFPYIGDTLYIPKPMLQVQSERDGNSADKKNFKKMKYIPIDKVDDFVKGNIDAAAVNNDMSRLGSSELRTQASIKGLEETLPYHVGVYRFAEGNGLYMIAGYESDEDKYKLEDLLIALSYDGIGGKRSSGLGRFTLKPAKMPEKLAIALQDTSAEKYIALSVCLPDSELDDDLLAGASYGLIRRGGFVYSADYAAEPRRKKDIYLFQPGSVFEKRFKGSVFDVSDGGSHPVYRYAMPLWMGVQ